MKNFNLTLSAYRDIKKMSYEDMAKCTADIFAKGVKAGKESVTSSGAFIASLRDILKEAYDIGDTRADAILEQLAKVFAMEITKKLSESAEIENLYVQNEVLQSEKENLMRTIEESPEIIAEAKREKSKEILNGFVHWLKGAIRYSYDHAVKEQFGIYGGKNSAFHEVLDLVKKVAEKEGIEVDE